MQPLILVTARAGNGTRTRDPNLGKVVLYQLSYSRVSGVILVRRQTGRNRFTLPLGLPLPHPPAAWPTRCLRPLGACRPPAGHGGEGDRTPDLVNAIHALSQLSYAPINIGSPRIQATAAAQASPRPRGCQAESAPSPGRVRGVTEEP